MNNDADGDRKPLTPTQRKILRLMRDHGAALISGGTRIFGSVVIEQGVLIRAYQSPEHFLVARGLLKPIQMNAPGRWYRLTEDGERRAAHL